MSLNARVELVHDCARCRVIRVYPDGVKTRVSPGQYGSLGLPSDSDPAKLVKRAYSVSSPLLAEDGALVDLDDLPYYEFFFNRVDCPDDGRERLTPKLFALKDGDRVFCGPKFSGHYTAEKAAAGKHLLLVATTTGEAPHNAILGEVLARKGPERVCSIIAGPRGWTSPYQKTHEKLLASHPRYKRLELTGDGYGALQELVSRCLADAAESERTLGFRLRPEECRVFLCGDPEMIGAPEKLGAWNYEDRGGGLMPLLAKAGFEPATRFKEGHIEHESYW